MAVAELTLTTIDDLAALKLRLALEGCEWQAPITVSFTDNALPLIRVHHPRFGTTYFGSWDTISIHCNEGWKFTYWPSP